MLGSILDFWITQLLGPDVQAVLVLGSLLCYRSQARPVISSAPSTISVILTPKYPIGLTDCRSTVIWLGWCSSPFTGNHAWSQEMVSLDYFPFMLEVLGSFLWVPVCLSWGHPCRFLGVSLEPGFHLTLK